MGMNMKYAEGGLRILSWRRWYELSQAQVAKAMGISTATIRDYERGKIGLDNETHEKLMAVIKRLGMEKAHDLYGVEL